MVPLRSPRPSDKLSPDQTIASIARVKNTFTLRFIHLSCNFEKVNEAGIQIHSAYSNLSNCRAGFNKCAGLT